MSQGEALSPTRIQIFRQIDMMLKESKNIEEARTRYRELVAPQD
ncbi:MAG TPA: hypothetical protein VFE98_05960 [Candidatus Bathyarchaeia archaeon]|nr:hypothetical protein [Candidatus Bathyarchaeia archaeon]